MAKRTIQHQIHMCFNARITQMSCNKNKFHWAIERIHCDRSDAFIYSDPKTPALLCIGLYIERFGMIKAIPKLIVRIHDGKFFKFLKYFWNCLKVLCVIIIVIFLSGEEKNLHHIHIMHIHPLTHTHTTPIHLKHFINCFGVLYVNGMYDLFRRLNVEVIRLFITCCVVFISQQIGMQLYIYGPYTSSSQHCFNVLSLSLFCLYENSSPTQNYIPQTTIQLFGV